VGVKFLSKPYSEPYVEQTRPRNGKAGAALGAAKGRTACLACLAPGHHAPPQRTPAHCIMPEAPIKICSPKIRSPRYAYSLAWMANSVAGRPTEEEKGARGGEGARNGWGGLSKIWPSWKVWDGCRMAQSSSSMAAPSLELPPVQVEGSRPCVGVWVVHGWGAGGRGASGGRGGACCSVLYCLYCCTVCTVILCTNDRFKLHLRPIEANNRLKRLIRYNRLKRPIKTQSRDRPRRCR
jgi:hypothetical protein